MIWYTCSCCCVGFFVFKQKTAYEMRISDWSSDVCSSDLETEPDATTADALAEATTSITRTVSASAIICFTVSGSTARRVARERPSAPVLMLTPRIDTARRMGLLCGVHSVLTKAHKIGRRTCRDRVCTYGKISVVAAPQKKKKTKK